MAYSITLPVQAETLVILPTTPSKQKTIWDPAKKESIPGSVKVDEKGRPLFGYKAVLALNGVTQGEVTVESVTALPENIPLGTTFNGQGAASLVVRSGERGLDLSLSVEGLRATAK